MKRQRRDDASRIDGTRSSNSRLRRWASLHALASGLAITLCGCGHVGVDLEGETLSVDDGAEDDDRDDDPSLADDKDDDKLDDATTTDDADAEDAGIAAPDASVDDDSSHPDPPLDDAGRSDASSDEPDSGRWTDAGADPPDAARDEAGSDEPAQDDAPPSDDDLIDDVVDDVIDDVVDDVLADDTPPDDDVSIDDEAMDDDLNVVDDMFGNLLDGGLRSDADSSNTGPSNLREPCIGSCTCSVEQDCEFECEEATCSPSCQAGSSCDVDAHESNSVNVECAEDAFCEARGTTEEPLSMSCKGPGECTGRCQQASSCSMDCSQSTGKCVLYCEGAADCAVICSEGADCYVVRQSTDTQVEFDCPNDARRECGDSITACNGECPTN